MGEDRPPRVDPTARVHPTALLEPGVVIGPRTSVWDNVHIRHGARLGHDTSVGEKTYIAYDVEIGNWVKLNAFVYICAEVTIEDGVMISAGATFTNDLFPRAMDTALADLETSAVTQETLATRVERGSTLGASCVIGPGLTLGRYCMVGMGATVTRDVPPHALVVGNPARVIGYVCACGPRLVDRKGFEAAGPGALWTCHRCGRSYGREGALLVLRRDPHAGTARLAP
jgi:acetyltransferase-like isoleucine patch superfamily enzyme